MPRHNWNLIQVSPDHGIKRINVIGAMAHLLETKRIKQVPVLRGGKVVGIVSRADLLRGVAARQESGPDAGRMNVPCRCVVAASSSVWRLSLPAVRVREAEKWQ